MIALPGEKRPARTADKSYQVVGVERLQPLAARLPLMIHHERGIAELRRGQRIQRRHILGQCVESPVRQHRIHRLRIKIIRVRRTRPRRPPPVNEELLKILAVRDAGHKRRPQSVRSGRPAADFLSTREHRTRARRGLIHHRIGRRRAVQRIRQRQHIRQRISAVSDLHHRRPLVGLSQIRPHRIPRSLQGGFGTIGAAHRRQGAGPGVIAVGGHIDKVGRRRHGEDTEHHGENKKPLERATVENKTQHH